LAIRSALSRLVEKAGSKAGHLVMGINPINASQRGQKVGKFTKSLIKI
jgi:hypothetical protein